jgi:hypothetical protein
LLDDWKFVADHKVVDHPEYTCLLEEFRRGQDQMMFIHFEVHKWSKETLKLAKKEFALLRQFVTCPLYGCGEVDDEKWANFVKLFGFKFLTNAICTDGKSRRVFIHLTDDKKKNEQKQSNTNSVVSVSPVECSAAVPVASVPRSAELVQSG